MKRALSRGAPDNVTVIVAKIVPVDEVGDATLVDSDETLADLLEDPVFPRFKGSLLALGGLLLVTVTGIQNVVSASPGLTRPRDLLNTTIGTAYLCVFALKMVAVFACVVTTLRIRRLLPTRPQFAAYYRLSSAGAMVNDDEPKPTNLALVYKLAETNAILAASIIGCVAVLGQLHQAIA